VQRILCGGRVFGERDDAAVMGLDVERLSGGCPEAKEEVDEWDDEEES
jgi:hypothetical protein